MRLFSEPAVVARNFTSATVFVSVCIGIGIGIGSLQFPGRTAAQAKGNWRA
jgi:hypothetical protein